LPKKPLGFSPSGASHCLFVVPVRLITNSDLPTTIIIRLLGHLDSIQLDIAQVQRVVGAKKLHNVVAIISNHCVNGRAQVKLV